MVWHATSKVSWRDGLRKFKTLEVWIGGSQFKASMGKKVVIPYVKEQAGNCGINLKPQLCKEQTLKGSWSKSSPRQKQDPS
jgi:hypothetical protein